jgi:amidase
MVVEHALTRSVRDSAALLDATRGSDLGAPYVAPEPERPFLQEVGRDPGKLRIAFTSQSLFGKSVHADCVAAVTDAAKLCEKLGHHVEEAHPPVDRTVATRSFLTILAAETTCELANAATLAGRRPTAGEFEPGTWFLNQVGRVFSAAELAIAVQHLHGISRDMARWQEKYDLFLTPTLGSPPPRLGELGPKKSEERMLGVLRVLPIGGVLRKALDQLAEQAFEFAAFTGLGNITGQPAMSVPLFWNAEGVPVGVQFLARYADEATLFRLASQLERERPWDAKQPRAV